MIYTVTFNPALDYLMEFNRIERGKVNRADHTSLRIGGKGINVSMILKELDVSTCALGFTAGFTGEAIEDELKKAGILYDFVHPEEGLTRINVKLHTDCDTDLNAPGPRISRRALDLLLQKLEMLRGGDIVVLSGSLPASEETEDAYKQITAKLSAKKIRFAADTAGEALLAVLADAPFLVKPNHHELGQLFKIELKSEAEIVGCAKRLQEMGAANVLVSRGSEGALLLDEQGRMHKTGIVQGRAVSAVGAGDSMVAGFLAGYLARGDYGYALRLGSAAANATAMSRGLGKRAEILRMMDLPELQVQSC